MPCLEILMHPVMIDGWLMRLGGGEAGNASAVHQLIQYYIKYILLIFQKMLLREGFQKKFLWKVWYFSKPWVHCNALGLGTRTCNFYTFNSVIFKSSWKCLMELIWHFWEIFVFYTFNNCTFESIYIMSKVYDQEPFF